MTADETQRLQRIAKIFVAEKNWEGCDGITVTEEMKDTVAGQATLLLLGADDFYFDNVASIIIFPAAFVRQATDGVIARDSHRAGETWQDGPITLS